MTKQPGKAMIAKSETVWMAWREDEGFMPRWTAASKEDLLQLISAAFLGAEENCIRVRLTPIKPRGKRRGKK